MKGVSIAIETIVYIVLAVIVLTVLLFFFTSQSSPAQDRFALENTRNQYCGVYAQNDIRCMGESGSPKGDATNINKLVEVCRKLSVASCTTPSLRCVQDCCVACGRSEIP